MSDVKTLLLVEDSPQDEMLTLRALKKANISNRIDVVRDGQQALELVEFADSQSSKLALTRSSGSSLVDGRGSFLANHDGRHAHAHAGDETRRGSMASRAWSACLSSGGRCGLVGFGHRSYKNRVFIQPI